jgi:hypothetical protein
VVISTVITPSGGPSREGVRDKTERSDRATGKLDVFSLLIGHFFLVLAAEHRSEGYQANAAND